MYVQVYTKKMFGWQCEITNISGSFRSCHCQPHQPSSWRAILIHSPQPYQVAKSSLRTSGKASNDFLKLVLEATIIPCFQLGTLEMPGSYFDNHFFTTWETTEKGGQHGRPFRLDLACEGYLFKICIHNPKPASSSSPNSQFLLTNIP